MIAASYAVCAALRLARFNVETSDEDDHNFSRPAQSGRGGERGRVRHHVLYAPARATTRRCSPQIFVNLQRVLPFFALLAAMLMVSRIPYPHVVNQVFRGQKPLRHLVGIIFSLVAVMVFRDYAVSIVCVTFVLYGPLRYVGRRSCSADIRKKAFFEEAICSLELSEASRNRE